MLAMAKAPVSLVCATHACRIFMLHKVLYCDYDYDYDLIQGKGDACKPAQYIVTLLLYS